MPCYNDGQYIGQAVDSFRMQTYQHIELVIVDDGSDDTATLHALNALSFSNVKIIQNKHSGPAFARNKGIAAASGSFILPLDADDVIDSTYIEKAVRILEENPDIGIVYCQAAFFGEKSGKWQLPPYSLKEMLVGNVIFSSAMFRKVDWEKAGGYKISMKYGLEDYDFWLTLLESGAQVQQIQEVLFHYRIKPVSRSSIMQKSMEMIQESYKQVYMNHLKLFECHNELYLEALREKLIMQAMDIEKLQNKMALLENRHVIIKLLKKIPGMKYLAKFILQGKDILQ
jgi:glycosyltransferase involved in cell wall biosynthesis